MGLSASQARFLQLTARRSNVEYQSQQINFQRLELATKMTDASNEYQNATSNRKMVFSFNDGSGAQKVDVSYNNYKNFMNQQMDGISTSQAKIYLMSSSGNKIAVANEEDRQKMIQDSQDSDKPLTSDDFIIIDGLEDPATFQDSIQKGYLYFATLQKSTDANGEESFDFKTDLWENIGGAAISEQYDTSDDAAAEAKYNATTEKIQLMDKKLELQLSKLETERNAIQTELDSVSKVIEDNIEGSFKVFS